MRTESFRSIPSAALLFPIRVPGIDNGGAGMHKLSRDQRNFEVTTINNAPTNDRQPSVRPPDPRAAKRAPCGCRSPAIVLPTSNYSHQSI